MTVKGYSAGTIFLQVVPVFKNVQRAVQDEAKDWNRVLGPEMEKSGEAAGRRAGKAASAGMRDEMRKGNRKISADMEHEFQESVRGLERALGNVDTRNLGKKLRADIKQIRGELQSINDVDLKVDDNFDRVAARATALRGEVENLRKRSKIFFDTRGLPQVYRKIKEVEAAIQAVDATVDVDVDTKGVERKLGTFERSIKAAMNKAGRAIDGSVNKEVRKLRDELDYLSRLRVNIDIGANQIRREAAEIRAELEAIAKSSPDIDVRVDAGRAFAELALFDAKLDDLDHKRVDVTVGVDKNISRELGLLAASGNDAANTFRSFNIVMLAASTIGPALIPILGGLGGALLAIAPAAAVAAGGLTAVIIGFTGIGDAVTALQAQEDALATTAQSSAKTQEAAARRVADARRNAARSIEAALEQQRAAQERYSDSIQDVKDAEEALRQARRSAAQTGEDIDRAQRQNRLDISQGQIDAFNATVTYQSVLDDGSATNAEREQARINMEQAKIRLEELRQEQKELAKEKRKWDKEGVEGTDEVQSAQEALNSALDAQKEAYRDLGDAARDVDRARADGARQVADALHDQAAALDSVNSQQANVDSAFDKLGVAGQKFSLFLFALRGDFYDFRDDIQAVLLPSVQQAIEGFFDSAAGDTARRALIALADSFGRIVLALSRSFQGPAWAGFFQVLADLGPQIQDAYGRAFISFLEAMASIMTTLAPFALRFADGLAGILDSFAAWAASPEGQKQLEDFMEAMFAMGPDILQFIGAFAGFVAAVAKGLSQWGGGVLSAMTEFLEFISEMDEGILSAIITALLVVIASSQTAYAVVSLLLAGGALLGSTVGAWIFGILALIGVFAYLYQTVEGFRDFVDEAWDTISEAFSVAYNEYIEPALDDLKVAFMDLWDRVLQPFFSWLGPILIRYLKEYIPALGKVFGIVIRGIAWLISNILVPALVWVGKAAVWLWQHYFKPSLELMASAWDDLSIAMLWVWDHVIHPMWDGIVNHALPALVDGFQVAIDAIGRIWDDLKTLVATPLKFVLDTLINEGLIDGFNQIARWVGAEEIDKINIPSFITNNAAYATGGILPGYTPGRDPHKFVSPTGGRLELSGGEAIMRPEWTAAVGPSFVNTMNAVARTEGIAGIRRLMGQAYAKGGIFWPLPGGVPSTYTGHDGVDLNAPNDLGKPFYSATYGKVSYVGYGHGYGNAVFVSSPYGTLVYGHSLDGSVAVSPGQGVAPGTFLARVGSTGNSSGPHLHFGFPGGTYADAMSLLANAYHGVPDDAAPGNHRKIPDWLLSFVKDPLGGVKGWLTKPLDSLSNDLRNGPVMSILSKIPLTLAEKTVDKAWDIIPGWVKTTAGWAGDAADWAIGGVRGAAGAVGDAVGHGAGAVADFLGLAKGGILPYNGTMKYDAGGYLPPGLTSVVNLTGKPEPVFTAEQFANMGTDGNGAGESWTYSPTFNGTDLTPADIGRDVNHGLREVRRSSRHQR